LNIKVLSIDTEEYKDNGFGLDLGAQFKSGLLRTGLSVTNAIPPGISSQETRSYAESIIRGGVGVSFSYPTPVTTMDGDKVFNTISIGIDINYHTGMEKINYGIYADLFRLRSLEKCSFGLSCGLGYNIPNESYGLYAEFELAVLSLNVGMLTEPGISDKDEVFFTLSIFP
jgi:hypothetical protein